MRRLFVLAALLFALPGYAATIDWVAVGDPGNACDVQSQGCFGAVDYVYRISKYEVTNAQYAEFLNAVADTDTYELYSTFMGSGWGGINRSGSPGRYTYAANAGREDMPVNYVSFYDSLRFANWLHNGQPTGAQDSSTTEDGAYTITSQGMASNSITRNAGATIFLTSEDEWYKAAYYDSSTPGYNPYPFADGFNGAACERPPGTTSHSANCSDVVADLTDVGAYTGSPSDYATFDQGGNIWEWNEAIIDSNRGLRGGSFVIDPSYLAASSRYGGGFPTISSSHVGFRVGAVIPEPATGLLLAVGLAGLAAGRRRRRRS
jgi:formylglycine-generating enzyme required for sulfatase activity